MWGARGDHHRPITTCHNKTNVSVPSLQPDVIPVIVCRVAGLYQAVECLGKGR